MWGHFVIQSVIPAVILSCNAVHHLRITLSQEGMVGEVASFGDWIRRRRRALDLTREALAGQVGCAVVTIRKIETDERRPSRQIAAHLAECLLIPAQERAAFLQAARAELAVDRLTLPPLHTGTPPAGYTIAATESAPSQSATLHATIPPPQPMPPIIMCAACGVTVPADQQFCGQCGTLISRICVACGAKNPGADRFCSVCGFALELASPLATAIGKEPTAAPWEERRWVTVLFADLSGFTAMAEQIDPEDVKVLVTRYIDQIGEQIRRFGGTIVNVMGDALLAIFGVPLAHEDDATRAVRAAIALRDSSLLHDPTLPLTLHIGINTGEVLATMQGTQERQNYTILGDTVNTADRIRNAAPAGSVLVAEETYRATHHCRAIS